MGVHVSITTKKYEAPKTDLPENAVVTNQAIASLAKKAHQVAASSRQTQMNYDQALQITFSSRENFAKEIYANLQKIEKKMTTPTSSSIAFYAPILPEKLPCTQNDSEAGWQYRAEKEFGGEIAQAEMQLLKTQDEIVSLQNSTNSPASQLANWETVHIRLTGLKNEGKTPEEIEQVIKQQQNEYSLILDKCS